MVQPLRKLASKAGAHLGGLVQPRIQDQWEVWCRCKGKLQQLLVLWRITDILCTIDEKLEVNIANIANILLILP